MVIFCELQCAVNRFCVAYNYKKKVDGKGLNCQLTNTTEHKFDKQEVTKEEQVWTFYKINVDRSQFEACQAEVNECYNGGTMIWDPDEQYFCQCLDCYEGRLCENVTRMALGMENGQIRDNQITASSEYDIYFGAANGRLNFTPRHGRTGSWSSLYNDLHQWLQVDFQRSTMVTEISTQGRSEHDQFVKSYTVSSSQDGKIFQVYTTGEAVKEFKANSDKNTIVHHKIVPYISTRFIRVHPTDWGDHISMRVEFYGCYKQH
ncbi:EGF-like repeat and discoidin I-like domain-containing protein 3 [Dendronephthya gigantea]|uniref:EGF-like repeat and discoidin I-like domain-containing protein 3 n=1 Tax=Dendronephthya gigantea TaxID=151771 RepID=UPI00106CD640|nr:EGF-like repeat and discoidin I-like domain-containing protein 3 [Dendronephthya gigantea]